MTPDILLHDSRWNDDFKDIESWIAKVMSSITLSENLSKSSELSLVFTDDKEIKQLNKQYRNADKATNVLSFPNDEPNILGDVIISFDTISHEAKEQRKTIKNHTAHMLLHGILHLLGYDHIEDKEAEIMEAKEISILKELEINNPYE